MALAEQQVSDELTEQSTSTTIIDHNKIASIPAEASSKARHETQKNPALAGFRFKSPTVLSQVLQRDRYGVSLDTRK